MRYADDRITEEELERARERLRAFEEQHRKKHRIERLRRVSPFHPLLLGMRFTIVSGAAMLILAIGLALAPFVSRQALEMFARLPGIRFAPLALLALALCCALLWAVFYGLALAVGTRAPFLPREVREQNRLRSEVQRLTVARQVQKRLTATPAPARLRR